MNPCDLVTLDRVREDLRADPLDSGSNERIARAITDASSRIDTLLGRPLVYHRQGQTHLSLASDEWENGSLTVTARSGPLTVYVSFSAGCAAGKVTVTGLLAGAAVAEEHSAAAGGFYGTQVFDSVSTIVVSGASGTGTINVWSVPIVTGYYSPEPGTHHLWLARRPIVTLYDIMEDATRSWPYGTGLTENVNWTLTRRVGRLDRIGAGSGMMIDFPEDYALRGARRGETNLSEWLGGSRVVRVRYVGGYRGTPTREDVPGWLQEIASKAAIILYRERERKDQGLTSKSDGAGGVTKYQQDCLSPEMISALNGQLGLLGPQEDE